MSMQPVLPAASTDWMQRLANSALLRGALPAIQGMQPSTRKGKLIAPTQLTRRVTSGGTRFNLGK